MADKKINGSLEITGKLNPNTSGYGILLPDTSTLTDDTSLVTSASAEAKEDKSNKVTSISSSSTNIEYPSAKAVYDLLGSKQDTLVSGTNIKTINNQSLLGSGNLDISGGMQNPMTAAGDIIVGGTSGAPSRLAKGSNNQLLGVDSSGNIGYLNGIPYLTTAPSADNTDGDLKFVVLSAEPATRYNGYLYIITGSAQ